MNTASPHLHRVTPRRSGGVGAPLATTLANVPDAEVERADVRAILKTRVARGAPAPPDLHGASAMNQESSAVIQA